MIYFPHFVINGQAASNINLLAVYGAHEAQNSPAIWDAATTKNETCSLYQSILCLVVLWSWLDEDKIYERNLLVHGVWKQHMQTFIDALSCVPRNSFSTPPGRLNQYSPSRDRKTAVIPYLKAWNSSLILQLRKGEIKIVHEQQGLASGWLTGLSISHVVLPAAPFANWKHLIEGCGMISYFQRAMCHSTYALSHSSYRLHLSATEGGYARSSQSCRKDTKVH